MAKKAKRRQRKPAANIFAEDQCGQNLQQHLELRETGAANYRDADKLLATVLSSSKKRKFRMPDGRTAVIIDLFKETNMAQRRVFLNRYEVKIGK